MKKSIIYFLGLLTFVHATYPSITYSLERDYAYSGGYIDDDRDPEDEDEDGTYIYYYDSDELCYQCFDAACYYETPSTIKSKLDVSAIPSFDECAACYNHAIYSGYLHFRYKRGFPFLKRQIEYSKKYPQYQAYWPETSRKAEKISDIAVILFEDLIDSTALKRVKNQSYLSSKFITDSWYFGQLGFTLPRSLSACCFRFSDFYTVCKDLEDFSKTYFSDKECALIQEKTCAILDRLSGNFLELYSESLALHPTDEIQSEINFIELLYANERDIKIEKGISALEKGRSAPFAMRKNTIKNDRAQTPKLQSFSENPNAPPNWLIGDYWFYEGIRCNDHFLHSEQVLYESN